ncbi:MAG TPA: thioesterase family protein [Acidimicrobiales bacterium]|nr:thioesterase family protein [Acidimicrobiales bacterium]
MGELGSDTAVALVEPGLYRGRLQRAWEIWGPNGGYIASVALRAAAEHAELLRPASFSCQYLAVGAFDDVDARVVTTRRTKRAEAVTVELHQGERLLLTAQAWFIDDNHEGLEHDFARMPDVAHWSELPTVSDHLDRMGVAEEERQRGFTFWGNFEERPTVWHDNWEDRPAGDPVFTNWVRYNPTPDTKDVAVDAARLIVLADTVSWPSATRAYSGPLPWMAPSLDLNVQFHRFEPEAEWLLMAGRADVSTQGLFAFRGEVWSENRTLLASSSGQCFYRALDPAQVR